MASNNFGLAFEFIPKNKDEKENPEDGEEEGTNPEEEEVKIEFKPVVQLKEVEVKTLEENEDSLFKMYHTFFRFINYPLGEPSYSDMIKMENNGKNEELGMLNF
jgi:hypothetical protein